MYKVIIPPTRTCYEAWCVQYDTHLLDMYGIYIDTVFAIGETVDVNSFNNFCAFIYNASSKNIY